MIKVFICFLLLPSVLFCQIKELPPKVKVMTLGVFHFNFPNLDVKKTEDKDKIDVYEEKYQEEINKIVMSLKEFRPTKIAIEVNPSSQKKIDSLYLAYKMNNHKLSRNEVQQLGFRLGKELAHTKLYCVDDWGKLYENLNYLFDDTSSRAKTFEYFYFNNPDSIFNSTPSHSDESKGIVFNLLDLNNPQK